MIPLVKSNRLDTLPDLHVNSNESVIETPYKATWKHEPATGRPSLHFLRSNRSSDFGFLDRPNETSQENYLDLRSQLPTDNNVPVLPSNNSQLYIVNPAKRLKKRHESLTYIIPSTISSRLRKKEKESGTMKAIRFDKSV